MDVGASVVNGSKGTTLSTTLLAQDPSERFDVVRADGTSTGQTKPRAAVHRDGDWHRSVHVWVYGEDGGGVAPLAEHADGTGPFLLFQQRGLDKDTWPGRLDATVGGHFGAGEEVADALREVDEEIGVSVRSDRLRVIGLRVCANEAEPGILDRELQTVCLLRDDRSLTDYRLNPAEVAALVRFPLGALLPFLAGETAHLAGTSIAPNADASERCVYRPDDFVPNVDRYFYRVAIATAAVLRGDRHVAV